MRILLSKDRFDKILSGVRAGKENSSHPCVSCSAMKWEEREYGFHLSIEASLLYFQVIVCLSIVLDTLLMMLGNKQSLKEEEVQIL